MDETKQGLEFEIIGGLVKSRCQDSGGPVHTATSIGSVGVCVAMHACDRCESDGDGAQFGSQKNENARTDIQVGLADKNKSTLLACLLIYTPFGGTFRTEYSTNEHDVD